MSYPKSIKTRVITLRRQGLILDEIRDTTGVAKGTISVWLRHAGISEKSTQALVDRRKQARLKAASTIRRRTEGILLTLLDDANKELLGLKINKSVAKLLCAMIYYCEGVKNPRSPLIFINSDPRLIQSFLELLRQVFVLDERKFRVCLHLHSYHDRDTQMSLWSKITHIPKSQFIKPYIKDHTGIRKREGYQGCASIRYHDTNLSRQLLMMAKAFIEGA